MRLKPSAQCFLTSPALEFVHSEVKVYKERKYKYCVCEGANHHISCMTCFPVVLCMFILKIILGFECGVHSNYITPICGIRRSFGGDNHILL